MLSLTIHYAIERYQEVNAGENYLKSTKIIKSIIKYLSSEKKRKNRIQII